MRAVQFSPEQRQAFFERQRQEMDQLQLPEWPIFAPVDMAYPAWLYQWSPQVGAVESLSFACGARRGLPRVTVENRPAGGPAGGFYRSALTGEDSDPVDLVVDGVAHPAWVQHQAGDRVYTADIGGTDVVVAVNGRRGPDLIELRRVTDLTPYRQRTLELGRQDPDGSREWQNPDAWEDPPDTTTLLWAHHGLLQHTAAHLQMVLDQMRQRPPRWPPLPASYVHDGGHWWAAAQHEHHRLMPGTRTAASNAVHDMVQLISLLAAHATWWPNYTLREQAMFEIALYRTGADTTVASADAQRTWARYPSQGTGPTPAPGTGSDQVLTAWQIWADSLQ